MIANGDLKRQLSVSDGQKRWYYTMQNPMSSYLVAIAMGPFEKQTETSSSGIPLEYFYTSGNKSTLEPTYRHTKEIFDF